YYALVHAASSLVRCLVGFDASDRGSGVDDHGPPGGHGAGADIDHGLHRLGHIPLAGGHGGEHLALPATVHRPGEGTDGVDHHTLNLLGGGNEGVRHDVLGDGDHEVIHHGSVRE